jgi:hypothetical protein
MSNMDKSTQRKFFYIHPAFSGEGKDVRCRVCEKYVSRSSRREDCIDIMEAHFNEVHADEIRTRQLVNEMKVSEAARKSWEMPLSGAIYVLLPVIMQYKPKAGLETELVNAALLIDGDVTVDQLTKVLLESGAYNRVAPKAAAAYPAKPVEVLLKQLVVRRVAKLKDAE